MKFLCKLILVIGMPFVVASNECPTPCHASTTAASSTQPLLPTQTITVGGGTNLRFSPPYLQRVVPGTTLRFDFLGRNHTLTESSRDLPCTKLRSPYAIDTDFQNFNPNDVSGLKTFDLKVTSFDPKFFYCKQGNGTPNGHCLKGMVFAINVADQVFKDFQTKAMKSRPMFRGLTRSKSVNL
ncbi:hypothetical protein LOZ51_006233 [Ophidiomyces ophidiicola]|nr:hypothetical protein LOZ55_003575 [Ophidiomyces ophidiicola]KAI1985885.1 hypothetical protein LOZ51_006233 [Ophidiomyces ophidiicola]